MFGVRVRSRVILPTANIQWMDRKYNSVYEELRSLGSIIGLVLIWVLGEPWSKKASSCIIPIW